MLNRRLGEAFHRWASGLKGGVYRGTGVPSASSLGLASALHSAIVNSAVRMSLQLATIASSSAPRFDPRRLPQTTRQTASLIPLRSGSRPIFDVSRRVPKQPVMLTRCGLAAWVRRQTSTRVTRPLWDHLAQQTTLLTTLSFIVNKYSRSSTVSSYVHVSNPGLQELTLAGLAISRGNELVYHTPSSAEIAIHAATPE